jgi:predicted permease
MRLLNELRQDVAYALRQIARKPGFALVIVVTLGSAMGLNTSFFSLFNAGELQPWPVRDPERVVVVDARMTLGEWRYWTEHTHALSGVAAAVGGSSARSDEKRLYYDYVDSRYFDVLVPLARGRAFSAGDDRPGGAGGEAVISHRLWESRYDESPAVLGAPIVLDGVRFTIVGVAARGFGGTGFGPRDLWLPLAAFTRMQAADASRDWAELTREVTLAGRLAPGVTVAHATAELATLSRQFRGQHGLAVAPIVLTDTRPFSRTEGSERLLTALWFTAMTFATLIACANVANLLLARGHARRGEIAVRLSLGAGRARVVRQLLTEALVLALLGGFLGVAIAAVLPGAVVRRVPEMGVRAAHTDIPVDGNVFLYALGLCTLACLAFGLAPALHCTRLSVGRVLKDAHGLSVPSLKTSLLGYQVIVSVMLLTAAGLLVRSAQEMVGRDLGYTVDGLVFVGLEFPSTRARAERVAVARRMVDDLREWAGSGNVAAASAVPRPGRLAGSALYFDLEGSRSRLAGKALRIHASPEYFALLRIPVVAGRSFTAADAPDAVAMVNEAFARAFSPGEPVVGKTIALPRHERYAIVGITRDVYLGSLDTVEPLVFTPVTSETTRFVMLREQGPGRASVLRALLARIDAGTHAEILSGPAWIRRATALSLFGARMIGGVGVMALALATLGLFSVSAYSVQQRTREIGVRMALGARPSHVVRAVLEPASKAIARGLVIGGAGAVALAFLMRQWDWLNGLSPLDPLTYVGVLLVLVVAGLVASYLPARRAMKVEPTVALRYE